MKLRSELMIQVSEFVKYSELTQTLAAEQLDVTQPRLNDELKGRFDKCTVDRLNNMLDAVGPAFTYAGFEKVVAGDAKLVSAGDFYHQLHHSKGSSHVQSYES